MKSNVIITIFLFLLTKVINDQSINESKFIKIGGIEQWITIKGEDSSKPVILFLHGGPGSTMSQYEDVIYREWDKDFVLVNWDQRGAGKTYARNAPKELSEDYLIENPLTIEQMTDDGIEVAEYLIKHLNTSKIILIGTSWGSVLGVNMALKRPDLFYAYVGHSQLVNPSEDIIKAYNKVYNMAEEVNDQEALNKLKQLGVPPYDSAKNVGQLSRILKKYESENSVHAPETWWKLAPEYDNEIDAQYRYDGDDYSFINYVGDKKMGIKAMSDGINFMNDGLEFKIPVYLIHGAGDIMTTKETAKEYFDQLKAPKKEFFLIHGAAHGHNLAIVDAQYKIVKEKILPDIGM